MKFFRYPPEHQEGTEILGVTGQDHAYRRGGHPGVGNVLRGGRTCGADFRLRVMGLVRSNG